MDAITFVLNTTQAIFENWLTRHTTFLWRQQFPTETGYVTLQRFRPSQNGRISSEGMYVRPVKNEAGAVEGFPMGEVLYFDLTPLSPDRLEVKGYCGVLAVREYYHRLLIDIAKCWLEAAAGIVSFLETIYGKAEAGQPAASGAEGARPPMQGLLSGKTIQEVAMNTTSVVVSPEYDNLPVAELKHKAARFDAMRQSDDITEGVSMGLMKTRQSQKGKGKERGIKAGTDERVKNAHGLLKVGKSRRAAFREAHTDSRTYYQYCRQVTGEEPIEPYIE